VAQCTALGRDVAQVAQRQHRLTMLDLDRLAIGWPSLDDEVAAPDDLVE
jgi:hypothetical protein